MKSALTYSQLNSSLLQAIPELRLPYERELRALKGEQPGPHILFGDVLAPYLIAQLQQNARAGIVTRILAFLEEMASSPDPLVREVVGQAVGEALWNSEVYERA